MSNKYLDNLGLSTILKIISNLLKSTNRKMELEVGKVENNKVDKTVSGVLYNDSNLPYTSSINRTLGSSDTSPTLESCIISPNSTSKYSGVKLSNGKIHISQSSNQSGAGAMGDNSSLIILGGGYKRPSSSRLELYSRGAKYPDYTQVENDISLGDQELVLSSSRLSDASHGITYLNNDAITITPTSTTIKNLVEPTNRSDAATKQYVDSHSGGGSVTVDDSLSTSSTNPVQNRVITDALDDKLSTSRTSGSSTQSVEYVDGEDNLKGLMLSSSRQSSLASVNLTMWDEGWSYWTVNHVIGTTYYQAGVELATGPDNTKVRLLASSNYETSGEIVVGDNGTIIRNVSDPVDDGDAANKKYVDDAVGLELIFRVDMIYDSSIQSYIFDGVQVVKGDIETVHQVLATNPNAYINVKVYTCSRDNSEYIYNASLVNQVTIQSDGYVNNGSIYGDFSIEGYIPYLISWGSDYIPTVNSPVD